MIKRTFLLLATLNLIACTSSGTTFTLYRNSVLDANMRIHVATFDTSDGDAYNAENCRLAAELFRDQQGVMTSFWCEKGLFKK